MPRAQPGQRFGGRAAGTPNRFNADVKAMILTALKQAGGADYLLAQARTNPGAFLTLVGKVLPMQMNSESSGKIIVEWSKEPIAGA